MKRVIESSVCIKDIISNGYNRGEYRGQKAVFLGVENGVNIGIFGRWW